MVKYMVGYKRGELTQEEFNGLMQSRKCFQWPSAAIEKVNSLIKNGQSPNEAIQSISQTLERNENGRSYSNPLNN